MSDLTYAFVNGLVWALTVLLAISFNDLSSLIPAVIATVIFSLTKGIAL